MKKFYLHNGTNQEGPFDFEDLKTKNISRSTNVWYEGLSDWTSADKLEELNTLFIEVPPPFNKTPPDAPSFQNISSNQTEEYFAQADKKRGLRVLLIIIVLTLVGLGYYVYTQNDKYSNTGNSGTTYEEKVMSIEEIERSQPVKFLVASGKYNSNLWGNKIKIHGTITNKATVATFKDAVVRVTYFSKTHTAIASNEYTIYETISPNSTSTFELKIENYSNINSIDWKVVSAIAM